MSLQMQVTVAGMEKKSANPNAPYSLNTSEGVRFKVFDRDGIVVRLMQLVGQPIVVNYREETNTYVPQQGPKAGQEVTTTDRIVESILPAGTPVAQPAPAVQPVPQAAPAAPVAAAAQPAAPGPMSVGVNWDRKDYSIWRQTAMKIAGHLVSSQVNDGNHDLWPLERVVTLADDLVYYFEHGRLPDKISDGQHKAIEALCGELDKLEPSATAWRDRVKAQARRQYGREVPSMLDLRRDEAGQLIDLLQGKVHAHQAPPAPPVDPVGQAIGEAFPGAEEARPPFASDDDIPFQPTTMDNVI